MTIPTEILSKAKAIYEGSWPDPVAAIAEAIMEAHSTPPTLENGEILGHIVIDPKGRSRVTLVTQYDPMASAFWIGGSMPEGYAVIPLCAAINPRTMSPEALEAHVKELQSIINENRETSSW